MPTSNAVTRLLAGLGDWMCPEAEEPLQAGRVLIPGERSVIEWCGGRAQAARLRHPAEVPAAPAHDEEYREHPEHPERLVAAVVRPTGLRAGAPAVQYAAAGAAAPGAARVLRGEAVPHKAVGRAAGVRSLSVPPSVPPGVAESVAGEEEARHAERPHELYLNVTAGDTVRPAADSRERAGQVVATGADVGEGARDAPPAVRRGRFARKDCAGAVPC